MSVVVVTGSNGLVGAEAVRFFSDKGFRVVGVDNDSRASYFGSEASTSWVRSSLLQEVEDYRQIDIDIRDVSELSRVFSEYGSDIVLVVHTAAQPSHDWAATNPTVDFDVNARGTLNLLEMSRSHCPQAVFIFTSTNKVYGDTPNMLPLVELETRWELERSHTYFSGVDESMSIDQSKHSLFGVSKVSADLLVQEYGRYFGMSTGVFRGGCLTGPGHSGTQLHGFLSYLIKCNIQGLPYTVFGHNGKQVRDNIHSFDLVNMFWSFFLEPHSGEVYNVGGGRHSNCSVLEAISLSQEIVGKTLEWKIDPVERNGDHRWYISDISKFRAHYPNWEYTRGISEIISEIVDHYSKPEEETAGKK